MSRLLAPVAIGIKYLLRVLYHSVDDDTLYEKSKDFGEMYQAKVVYDSSTAKSRGFGFITFTDYLHAIEKMDKHVSRMKRS